jgi:prolyl-tRNA synthetase
MDTFVAELTKKSVDLSRWYTEVVLKAQLADYWQVHGFQVLRPYGFALWENMQALLDRKFKRTGHKNAYFPLLMPESLLNKEAEHVEGFAPEVFWVTQTGQDELSERLLIRPTSEAIIMTMYAKWIDSWRDLPVLINQWNSVLRAEKTTRFFLRTSEFLWQEGHTAHRSEEEAREETMRMLEVYREFVEEDLAIPVVPGRKTDKEKFAGARETYTLEALMPDGQALQSCTSHFFGDDFARAFDITFQDTDGQRKHVHTTSWGLSWRTVGGLIMVHGDDAGLIIPPKVAPVQVVVVPIRPDDPTVREAIEGAVAALGEKYRVEVDWSDRTPGWKFNEWELRGVPLRMEIGPRDAKAGQAVLVRRDNREKSVVPLDGLVAAVEAQLGALHAALYDRALADRAARTTAVDSYDELKRALQESPGFIRAQWCGARACEDAVKTETGATIRCIPLDAADEPGTCVYCGTPSTQRVLFGRAY